MPTRVDVLVPTCNRPAALAATLAALIGQTYTDFRIVIADQSDRPILDAPEVRAGARVLAHCGHEPEVLRNVPRRGVAHNRQVLLEQARAPFVLFLDDDVLCEPHVLARLVAAIERHRCGFVGAFVEAPGAVTSSEPPDVPADDLCIEPWRGRVRPERVEPGGHGWERRHLHFAAHLRRVGCRQGLHGDVLYKVAWVGGCVLYDRAKLLDVGGFSFWRRLPPHGVGEDVLAQLRVMERHGGAGLYPSGAWHQEVPTTLPRRDVDAPFALDAG